MLDNLYASCDTNFYERLPQINLGEKWGEHMKSLKQKAFPMSLNKNFKCLYCSKTFKFQSSLSHHMCSKKFYLTCKDCGKTFTRRSSLIDHFRIHSGEKPFKCDICNKNFSKKYNLVVHKMRHRGEKPFQCKICSKSFLLKHELNSHIFSHTLSM